CNAKLSITHISRTNLGIFRLYPALVQALSLQPGNLAINQVRAVDKGDHQLALEAVASPHCLHLHKAVSKSQISLTPSPSVM
ncbi:hypothetical protein L0F63_005760, partial [Massospora cicadina]